MVVAVLGFMAGSGLDNRWLRWGVRAAIWMLGAMIVYFILQLMRRAGGPRKKAAPDPVDGILSEARKRLKAAGVKGRGAMDRLPMVLVMGPRGSAKTTLVLQSDLDAEHLAGNLRSDGLVAPTEALNLWYDDGRVVVEAAGALAVEPTRWSTLVSKLRPRRWLPALLGRPQAPRVAVVCFSVEDLMELSAGDGAGSAARNLRDRLTELSEAIGIRLPVYVVFTKADRIPHFEEFVENLTDPEVQEILGTTLRALGESTAGTWAEREKDRLAGSFEEMFQSLAERRLEVLDRAGSTEGNGAAYEFPREFRKLAPTAIDFLVELCRPSQLRVSPFLRGFYFTGVRPVVVEEGAPRYEAPPALEEAAPAGATQVFNLQAAQARAAQASSGSREGRQRRVPQWVFLQRILRKVVLQDRVAMGITTSGIGLSALRRIYWAAGIGLFLVLGLSLMVSYNRERGLQDEVATAMAALPRSVPGGRGVASMDDIRRLDALRAVTDKLSRYENGHRPLRNLLFMYTGGDLYPTARERYFQVFRPLLFNRAFDGIQSDLRSPPEPPTFADYDRTYRALKAYIEMTDEPGHAEAGFFGDVLTDYWAGSEDLGDDRQELARAQFAFYGSELPYGNPYTLNADPSLVGPTRQFLVRNTNEESFYRSLVGQWSSRLPAARLATDRPETAPFVASEAEVPGAFTRMAWDSVHTSLARSDQALSLDRWVVGEGFFASVLQQGFDTDSLAPRLRSRYETDYRDAWVSFLSDTQLQTRSLGGARNWLADLGGNRSAVFQILEYVDSQTAVNAPAVRNTFAALDALVPPDSVRGTKLYSDEAGSAYLVQLQTLGQAVGRLADSPGDPTAGDQVRTAAATGLQFVSQTSLGFPGEPAEARTASGAVTALLSRPFRWAEAQAGQGPQMAANGIAQEFCQRQEGRVLGRYPFEPNRPEAAVEDVAAFLAPDGGELRAFMDEVDATGANLTSAYDRFRTRALEVSRAFYQRGGDMGFDFTFQVTNFQGVDRVELRVDGQVGVFTPSLSNSERFVWDPASAEQAILEVRSGQNPPVSLDFAGPWAVFRLFHQGEWQGGSSGEFSVTWALPDGGSVTGLLAPRGGVPILRRGYLDALDCPRVVAR